MSQEKDERNEINAKLRAKRVELTALEANVTDIETVRDNRDAMLTEVETLNTSKQDLETFISTNTETKNQLTTDISNLTVQKEVLDTYVEDNEPNKVTLEGEISTLEASKFELESAIESNNIELAGLNTSIDDLKTEQVTLEADMEDLRGKHGLYTRDMKGISEDSKKQLTTYGTSAFFAIGATIALMIILLCFLTNSNPFKTELMKFFKDDPNLRFFSILTVRITISAAFIFLIIIFLNLSRGFISQYIKTRNRLSALHVTDFLIGRVQAKTNRLEDEESKLQLERDRIKEQVELMNEHLPKIIDFGPSSFEKSSNEQNSISQLKDIKDLFTK